VKAGHSCGGHPSVLGPVSPRHQHAPGGERRALKTEARASGLTRR
jgi:hypothetical protein